MSLRIHLERYLSIRCRSGVVYGHSGAVARTPERSNLARPGVATTSVVVPRCANYRPEGLARSARGWLAQHELVAVRRSDAELAIPHGSSVGGFKISAS